MVGQHVSETGQRLEVIVRAQSANENSGNPEQERAFIDIQFAGLDLVHNVVDQHILRGFLFVAIFRRAHCVHERFQVSQLQRVVHIGVSEILVSNNLLEFLGNWLERLHAHAPRDLH